MGFDYYANIEPLLQRLKQLDMWAQFQVENDLLLDFLPTLSRVDVKLMVDHCGRPRAGGGLDQAGFQAVLALAKTGRAAVKLSGYQKFSLQPPPYEDAQPFVRALLDAYTLDACFWASDWPFLKAQQRLDVGPLLRQVERLLPDPFV